MAAEPERAPAAGPYRGPERRQHPRAKTELPITIGAKDRRFAAQVQDLSRSGVSFTCPVAFTPMTVLRMDLELPGKDGARVRADGAVVRCVKSATGDHSVAVFFTAIEDEDRAAITSFVESRLTRV